MSKHRGFVLNSKQTLYFDGKKSSSFRTLTFDFFSSKHDGYVQVSKQTLYFDVKINIPDFMCLPSKLSSKYLGYVLTMYLPKNSRLTK